MVGDAIFNGLPFYFNEDDVPDQLDGKIPSDEYMFTIMNVNRVLMESFPCAGLIVLYTMCTPCSFGLSLIPLFLAGPRGEKAIRKYLQKQNETYMTKYRAKWELQIRKDGTPCSWVQFISFLIN